MAANLITLDEYKLALGIKDPKNDDRLDTLIVSVSQLVKTYCANSFLDHYTAEKTEFFNVDWESNIIQLTESPVVAITSVRERESYSSAYTTLTEVAFEYYLDKTSDCLYRTQSSGYIDWAQGPGAVEVVYTGGYEECPADLKLAVIDLVKYYFKEEYKERRSLAGASISNTPTSTLWRNVDFPDHIKRVLDLYKQIQV